MIVERALNNLPLIEKNRIKLADLEREWSMLAGSMRAITYTVVFHVEDDYLPFSENKKAKEIALAHASSLEHEAKEQGFDVNICYNCDYYLEATRLLKPTAENITLWEEWFRNHADNVPSIEEEICGYYKDGAVFEGWSYPKSLSPIFLITGDTKSINDQRARGAKSRTHVLFGRALCDFEASNGWYSRKKSLHQSSVSFPKLEHNPKPFKIVPTEFLKHAVCQRPSNPKPTASMFSQWLYALYADAYGDTQDRDGGKVAEKFVLEERRRAYVTVDYNTMHAQFPDWQLKHNGMNINQSDQCNYFTIDDLVVSGKPLRVLPDIIYENKRTGEIIIVEIKHSQIDIPTNLWPNIWGQLWCYSQMQEFRDSPKVTVIGEVWGSKNYNGCKSVYLRASVRRNPRAKPYDRFFRTLFDIYRGVH